VGKAYEADIGYQYGTEWNLNWEEWIKQWGGFLTPLQAVC